MGVLQTVSYYDDLSLPVERWFLLNQVMIRKIGIGNDIESVKQHFANLIGLLQAENYDSLAFELQNTFQACNAIITKEPWDIELYTLFVKSINGKRIEINEMSDLEEAVKLVSKTGIGEMKQTFYEIKKKLKINLTSFFLNSMKRKFRKLKSTIN